MNKRLSRRHLLCLTMILLFIVCMISGCEKEKKVSDAGCYQLYTMVAGTDSYDHETILKYGLDAMTLILYEDGTASLAFGNETPTEMTWKKGMINDGGDEIPYSVEDNFLTLTHKDETMVFEKVGNSPKKAEIQTPGNAVETGNMK